MSSKQFLSYLLSVTRQDPPWEEQQASYCFEWIRWQGKKKKHRAQRSWPWTWHFYLTCLWNKLCSSCEHYITNIPRPHLSAGVFFTDCSSSLIQNFCDFLFSLEPLEKVLVSLSVGRCGRNKMATRMRQDLRVLEGGEEFPAHVVRDDTILQSKHMQGRELDGSAVKFLVFPTCATETSDKDGKAEAELWLQFLFL